MTRDFVFIKNPDQGNMKSRISKQTTICGAWHWLNVLLYQHQTWLLLFLVEFSFKDQSFMKNKLCKMIRRKSDLLIKRRALKKGSPFFLDTNDNIPEHFKRVNAIEKVFIRCFIWWFIWLLSFSDQSSLSDFKAGQVLSRRNILCCNHT